MYVSIAGSGGGELKASTIGGGPASDAADCDFDFTAFSAGETLDALPDFLLEASVIGVPDSEYGEAVCAVVVVKPGTDFGPADITAFARSRLASYKKPRYLLVVDSLPRNPSQKVDKVLLRAQVGDGELVPQPLS